MNRLLTTGLAVALAAGLPASAQAQSRAGRGIAVRSISRSPTRVVRATSPRSAFTLLDNGVVVLGDTGLLGFDTFGGFPVPGLGFDFAHLAAVTRNIKVSDFSVLTTAQRVALFRQAFPVVPIAFPFFPAQAPAQIIVVQQPPVIVMPAGTTAEAPGEVVERPQPAPREESAATSRIEPAREVGEYVLVKRDGTMVFAVAFTTEGDLLTYVTREGIRRSFPLAQLDLDFTRRINEERGAAFHLPS